MSTPAVALRCFAYGEDVEGLAQRSLGYRLLAPAQSEPWCSEVEALARRLQTAPYPDHWPPTDLFCSVLLADGSRLVAIARYGLVDHTPSHRRGGLELLGVLGPAELDIASCLRIYRWLQQRRAATDDLHTLGGNLPLSEAVAAVPPPEMPSDPVPVLPIRLWQEGALLFAATGPSDPDHRITLLEQGAAATWQWLPLVGADFPFQTYAQRGPLIAWTPHLAGVAVKLDRRPPDESTRPQRERRMRQIASAALLILLIALMLSNLMATLALVSRPAPALTDNSPRLPRADEQRTAPQPSAEDSRDEFAEALYTLIVDHGGAAEWEQLQQPLQARYSRAVRDHKALHLKESNLKGRAAVGAVSLLSERSTRRIEEAIKKALLNRGYDAELVNVACQRVREQLVDEARKSQ
jgi:hypothetical protein